MEKEIKLGHTVLIDECISEEIKERKIKLHIHHIDYNKKNNNIDNLISLCQRCHIKTNNYRKYYEEYFTLIMDNLC